MEIFSDLEGWALLLRWVHILAGITWIGLLYYFNFVQAPFFAEIEPEVRTVAIRKLVPRALAWFRFAATATVAAGIAIILIRFAQAGSGLWAVSYGVSILTGMSLGFLMFLNVWGVIWPNQQIVIGSAEAVAAGGEPDPRAVAAGRRALLASRTNVVFSIPLVFFMATASHLLLFDGAASAGQLFVYWIIAAAMILGLEANALFGNAGTTTKPLDKVGAVILSGFVFYAVIYIVLQVVMPN